MPDILVLSDDFQPVRIRPFVGKLALLVDARLVLRVGGVAIVRDGEVIIVERCLPSRQTNHLRHPFVA